MGRTGLSCVLNRLQRRADRLRSSLPPSLAPPVGATATEGKPPEAFDLPFHCR
jgi:hypothetical protein